MAGTGGALQGADTGPASRPTCRPKGRPGQQLRGAGGGEASSPAAHLVLPPTAGHTARAPQSSAAPLLPCKRKSRGPRAHLEKLQFRGTCPQHPKAHVASLKYVPWQPRPDSHYTDAVSTLFLYHMDHGLHALTACHTQHARNLLYPAHKYSFYVSHTQCPHQDTPSYNL